MIEFVLAMAAFGGIGFYVISRNYQSVIALHQQLCADFRRQLAERDEHIVRLMAIIQGEGQKPVIPPYMTAQTIPPKSESPPTDSPPFLDDALLAELEQNAA